METNELYKIAFAQNMHEMITALNFIFQQMQKRFDQLNGFTDLPNITRGSISGTAYYQFKDATGTIIHQMGGKV